MRLMRFCKSLQNILAILFNTNSSYVFTDLLSLLSVLRDKFEIVCTG